MLGGAHVLPSHGNRGADFCDGFAQLEKKALVGEIVQDRTEVLDCYTVPAVTEVLAHARIPLTESACEALLQRCLTKECAEFALADQKGENARLIEYIQIARLIRLSLGQIVEVFKESDLALRVAAAPLNKFEFSYPIIGFQIEPPVAGTGPQGETLHALVGR